jgi:hypothetical protein
MKLRFRKNSLRLRLNQLEVMELAAGKVLKEQVSFPGGTTFAYQLSASEQAGSPSASFFNATITVEMPGESVRQWSGTEEIGLYCDLSTAAGPLKIAIEKDLVCTDGPPEESDPHAYPRKDAC